VLGTKSVPGDFSHEAEKLIWSNRNRRGAIGGPSMATSPQNNLTRQLCDSIDRLQKQVEQVEFWASAVTGFTQPVPGYEPETSSIARYVKPGRIPKKRRRRRAASQNDQRATKPASA